MAYDVQSIVEQAKEEVNEAKIKEAKVKIKAKLQQISAAEIVVANLKRELEVLVEQVNAEVNG